MNRWHKLAADLVTLWVIAAAVFFIGVMCLVGLYILFVAGVLVFG